MATLFSYFTKTPKKPSPAEGDKAEGVKENKKPKTTAKGISPPKKNGAKSGIAAPCGVSNGRVVKAELKQFDVVWAKMDGHPSWPSIICDHPTKLKFIEDNQCHVQFFGDPPSRGWVNVKQIQPFIKGEKKLPNDTSIREAVKEAESALQLSVKERASLIKCVPSDDEDVDEDISDDVLMECDLDSLETGNDTKKENESDDNDEVTGKKYNSRQPKRKAKLKGKKKRKRIMIESGSEDDGSEDDFKPDEESSDDDSVSSGVEECDDDEPMSEEDEEQSGSRKRKRGSTSSRPKSKKLAITPQNTPKNTLKSTLVSTPNTATPELAAKISKSANKAASVLSKFQMSSSPSPSQDKAEENTAGYVHEKLEWLKEGKRKDKHGRPMSHPEYDPKTLLVPSSYLTSKEVTPAMRQWWVLKSENFDTVLFFKVGKFYELYHTDAAIGVKELNLIFMKGSFAHAGFPEIAYDRYSSTLIQKGYKVARVEQTETPDMMKERCRKERTNSKYDQVVKREICAITTKGTRMYSFRDGDCTDSEAAYLLAISEKGYNDTAGGGSVYGVCFLDTSIGKFHLGQFEDDRQASRLRTLIAHHSPVQVLCPRGCLTSKTQHVLSHELMSALTEHLSPGNEFWDASKTLKFLAEGKFFQQDKEKEGPVVWPDLLKEMTGGDPLCLMASDDCELAISALGAIVWYLKKCLIEDELLSLGKFEKYLPIDCIQTDKGGSKFAQGRQRMILDDVTLTNLDVLPSGPDSSTDGTLLERIDSCSTSFGKRLFKQWLCAPLCNPSAINDRLNAIEDLMAVPGTVADIKDVLKTLPDLERLLRKIHSMGSHKRAIDHPDGRAILYNEDTYSKRKITDFLSALEGFSNACSIIKLCKDHTDNFNSKLLKQVTTYEGTANNGGGRFPELSETLDFFKGAFDHGKAKKDGVIVPKPDVNVPYDEALDDIKTCKNWFDNYLDKQRKRLNCRTIGYWGTAKNRYQLEVPDSASKHTPDEYSLQSQKKGYRRYWTPDIEDQLATLVDAEDRRDVALKDTMRTIFQKFDTHYDMWDKAVQCLAVLDALISLTTYSCQGDGPMCRPEIVLPQTSFDISIQPFLEIREGRHPCISRTFSGGDFIPNDTVVGIADESEGDSNNETQNAQSLCVLVTGPNMGGKSTLMRQAGLITIMAQLGCFVPAEKCRLTPVDRVFTRLGAHDRIMAGESTFFVELSETSTILRHSTANSLVLLDELGRGTATFDGTAIACAVVRELSSNIRCRTLFSTHYHSLVEDFANDPNVRLGHMACMVENDDEEGDPSKETITFLYKFVKGDCPKSYGFNAARLAGIPDEIISVAVHKAREFEETLDEVKLFKLITKNKSRQNAIRLIKQRLVH